MSRRIVAPLLLLLAAACSLAAVFAVHRIESSGGPLAEPFATRYFSPGLPGRRGVAVVRFTTQRPERITVRIIDRSGTEVRRLIDSQRISGREIQTWDGRDDQHRVVPDGIYTARITRAGDARAYAPPEPITVDTRAPRGRLDQATFVDGELRGLVVLEPGSTITLEAADGVKLEGLRRWFPRAGTVSGRPTGPRPAGSVVMRFAVPVDATSTPLSTLGVWAVDLAGNRTDLLRHAGAAGAVFA